MSGEKKIGSNKAFRLTFIAALLIATLLVADMARFAWICRQYSEHAKQGVQQLNVPAVEGEVLVVLTGDHGRIARAMEMLRMRGSELLIISGTAKKITLTDLVNQQGDSTTNIHETWKKIILESESSSTVENALETAKLLTKKKVQRLVLITSDYHIYRAAAIFRKTMPSVDLVEFATTSEVGDINIEFGTRIFTGVWKVWIEYWKYFHYRLVVSRTLRPFLA